jgi:DNA-binding transcriptional MerR regulator
MKTIKEAADRLGISKEALRKRISREPLKSALKDYITVKNGTKFLADKGMDIIMDASMDKADTSMDSNTDAPATITTNAMDTPDKPMDVSMDKADTSMDKLYDILKDELAAKNKQLEIKDKQIDELNARLAEVTELANTSQRLHAGTLQQLISTDEREAAPPKRGIFGIFGKKNGKTNNS